MVSITFAPSLSIVLADPVLPLFFLVGVLLASQTRRGRR